MQAQLFVSSALFFLSLAPASLACGPDNPDQIASARPQFSVSEVKDHSLLKFTGKTAQAIFDHLGAPEVKRFNTDFYQLKVGFGFICVAQAALQTYDCFEQLTEEGEIRGFFPYTESLKKTLSWIHLIIKGPSLEQIYNKMSEQVDMDEYPDGSLIYIKQRNGITCTKLVKVDGQQSFECSQLISAGGLPIGTGSDPLIGSGTHPVIDAEEGGNP